MRDHLVLYVNGQRREVRGTEAALTLSDWLRRDRVPGAVNRLTGTKIACAEGDCGACTVLVGRPADDRLEYTTVDACIAFVYQLDRTHVVTVEGLADREGASEPAALTPVQRAMVDCHGSQCGFCTPGFVMAMHGVLEGAEENPTDDDWRLGLSGNLCRCTGYAQILDAAARCDPQTTRVGERYDAAPILTNFASLGDGAVRVNARPDAATNGHAYDDVEVMLPTSVDELLRFRADRPSAKLVAGATDVGVQFNHGRIDPTAVIFTRGVDELNRLEVEEGVLRIGAAVDWSTIEAFAEQSVPEYHAILTRFGSPQVRHLGTLVGNLANGSPIADSIPFHYVAESVLELQSVDGQRDVPIESFYRGYKDLDLAPNEAITAVRTPLPTDGTLLKLYKISKRRDMDISTVTAAFWIECDGETIAAARVAVGGCGPTVVRLPQAEAALVGRPLSLDTMTAAGVVARGEITPITDVRGAAEYRLQLVENLFAKCFHDLADDPVTV